MACLLPLSQPCQWPPLPACAQHIIRDIVLFIGYFQHHISDYRNWSGHHQHDILVNKTHYKIKCDESEWEKMSHYRMEVNRILWHSVAVIIHTWIVIPWCTLCFAKKENLSDKIWQMHCLWQFSIGLSIYTHLRERRIWTIRQRHHGATPCICWHLKH